MKQIQLTVDDGKIEVVFNTCYGGFGLSEEAILRMIELGSEEAKNYYEMSKTLGYKIRSYNPEVLRFDPILVQTVRELKNKACGPCTELAIGKIKLINLIDIEDHDGKEDIKHCSYDYKAYGRYDEEYKEDD